MSVPVFDPNINQIVKIDITHSILSLRLPEIRFSLHDRIIEIKMNLERRFGTSANYMTLTMSNNNGEYICDLSDDYKPFGYYSPIDHYIIHCIDHDPNSICKKITFENEDGVKKYVMSDEDYDKLDNNVRKFKEILKKNNPELFNQTKIKHKVFVESDFEKDIADKINKGDRCEIVKEGIRGEVRFIGKMLDKGEGYFVGIRLDEPYGNNNGYFKGVKYFECNDSYGLFLRPSEINVGNFPELDIDEF